MGNNIALESISVSNIMVTNVKTAKKTQSIQEVCTVMSEEDGGTKILGIITNNDIFRAILKNQIFVSTFVNDQALVGPTNQYTASLQIIGLEVIYTDHDEEFLMTGKYCMDNKRNNFL